MKVFLIILSFLLSGCASTAGTSPRFEQLPTAPPPEYAHVPEKDETMEPPKALERVDPRAPREVSRSWMKATAEIGFIIDEQGRVPAAWYIDGDREWAKYVLAAVRQWRWEPATRDGKPVAIRTKMTSKFRSNY